MEREGGGEEGADVAEKKEFFGGKLKRGILVGKSRGGPYCTTPVPTWKFSLEKEEEEEEGVKVDHNYCNTINKEEANTTYPSIVSARKLGASLWEEIHQHLPLVKMPKAGVKHRHYRGEKGLELPTHFADPSHTPPEQPESASSLRRHVAASLMKHHQSIERNVHALRPVSPASYSSSMEMAAYNPPMTPTSSLGVSERRGESSYNLKTSTELLKVLNRIWSLEEQHTMNTSLMRALKIELNHARGKIKELLQEQHNNRQEIEELLKQVAEDNLVMKSKERDRINAAVKSVKDELEDERKLRKRSESLHRKLARELYELKFSFAKGLKELERERKARVLLEDLCDEFARGIGEYEQEVRAMKHKSEEHSGRDGHDRLILHISEAWLDERMQMKLAEAQSNLYEKNTILDKLSSEIETFLQAKRSGSSNNNDTSHSIKDNLRRHSLESVHLNEVHLNEAVSAPQDIGHGEGSVDGDSRCIDLTKNVDHKERDECPKLQGQESVEVHLEDMRKSYPTKKKLGSRERFKGRTPSNTQGQFEEQMAWAMSCNGNNTQLFDKEQRKVSEKEANPVDMSISRKSEICEATQEERHERKGKGDGMHGPNLNHVTDKLIRSQSLLSDGERVFSEKDVREGSSSHSAWRGHASPVQQWMSKFTSPDRQISESSSKWPWGVKENTLKAKLIEARIEGQHSRYKASKGTS